MTFKTGGISNVAIKIDARAKAGFFRYLLDLMFVFQFTCMSSVYDQRWLVGY
jgi:hypothetical protein